MKQFLKKRWHSIPVALVSAVLVLALVAGGAFATYGFLKADIEVEVGEAIAVGVWPAWDNLEPYGAGDDVNIAISEDGNGNPTITISTVAETPYVGEGFVAGESIVIPVNIRNGGEGSLDLSASVTGNAVGHLTLTASYETNTGDWTGNLPEGHEGTCWARDYTAGGPFTPLNSWSATVDGNSGWSGSAIRGAQVLFVNITAPGDVVPGNYTYHVTLSRS